MFGFCLFGLRCLGRIVSDVPSGTFELNRRRGENLLEASTAFLTLRQGFVAEFLKGFSVRLALSAFVLVNRHVSNLTPLQSE